MWNDKNTHKNYKDEINIRKNDLINKLSEYKTFNFFKAANQCLNCKYTPSSEKGCLKMQEFSLKKIVG